MDSQDIALGRQNAKAAMDSEEINKQIEGQRE